ncbi:14263_t:CDS:2, partial [Cetraspora pellucida]
MDSDEYTSDINRSENNEPYDIIKDPIEEPGANKIQVRFTQAKKKLGPSNKRAKISYVWKYFETEDERNILHRILETDNPKSNEKGQLHINKMIKKAVPHSTYKQTELKRATAKWLVTDSLPFNT